MPTPWLLGRWIAWGHRELHGLGVGPPTGCRQGALDLLHNDVLAKGVEDHLILRPDLYLGHGLTARYGRAQVLAGDELVEDAVVDAARDHRPTADASESWARRSHVS